MNRKLSSTGRSLPSFQEVGNAQNLRQTSLADSSFLGTMLHPLFQDTAQDGVCPLGTNKRQNLDKLALRELNFLSTR